MYSVYQHWDPLKVCAVGVSYPPELYNYIKNKKIRKVFYQIAEETEEDYQKLIKLLESFGVETIRPNLDILVNIAKNNIAHNQIIHSPNIIMQPRDMAIMLGETFYFVGVPEIWNDILSLIGKQGNQITKGLIDSGFKYNGNNMRLNGAMTTRVGRDLIVGTLQDEQGKYNLDNLQTDLQSKLPNYRVKMIDTAGHTDGCFTPVVPGLILSVKQPYNYAETFPDWEVVYLPNEAFNKVGPFLDLKRKNRGKWWVPGEELNQDFTDYVESWMNHWVGYVEESVFDVNMIVINKQNVIVNGYNKTVFDAFSKHGITPHICNFRHRYFWDGGLHCITNDLHREGTMQDYFPERG
jgi:N-dimethylarginine dimethylaminohydrolase